MKKSSKTNAASLKLNTILTKLIKGVETPKIQKPSDQKEAERLIEYVEIQNYPYPLIHCQHLEEKGIGEDCVACQQLQRETYKSRFLLLSKEKGYSSTHTLKAAFDYYSTLIMQYRLTECDELLDQIYSSCISRESWSVYYTMAIQARAFLRFKQGKYPESLEYFIMQLNIIGPNELIYENMALIYSRLGDFKEASICYARAILLIRKKPLEQQQFSTLLIGLSTVLNNINDSFTLLYESMKLLKKRFDKPHSLMAKTLTATANLHMKSNDISAAEKCYKDAVDIFINTCGFDTPLTANAMNNHAKCLLLLNNTKAAVEVYAKALSVWAKVDNESFEPNMVVEALMALMKTYSEDSALGKVPDETITILDSLQRKIAHSPEFINDLNILCLLKFIYEIYVLKGDIPRALACCRLFKASLSQLDETNLKELAPYRVKLLQETSSILQILDKM